MQLKKKANKNYRKNKNKIQKVVSICLDDDCHIKQLRECWECIDCQVNN